MFGSRTISADRGGMAAGRNIIGIPPAQLPAILRAATDPLERLNAELQKTVAGLEHQLGATQEQILGFFRIIGDADIAAEAIPRRLTEIAERHRGLLAQAVSERSDDAETARLKGDFRAALEKLDLERADALLLEIITVQDRDIQHRALQAALTCAQRGEVAMTRLRYREAAAHFAAAASRVPTPYEAERRNYLNRRAVALYLQGDEFGDSPALADAVEAFRALLTLYPRERAPLNWAATQNDLGVALHVLGERGDEHALHQAVVAFEDALLERMRERVPLDWAETQNNLGNVLVVLSERGDERALHRAIAAYGDALRERTRERAPLDWAATQNNLGIALRVQGERDYDEARRESGMPRVLGILASKDQLHRAVAAFEDALREYTRERLPLDWAMTQTNLGNALRILGERGDEEALRRSVAAFESALQEYTRERAPLAWAATQNNLGNALRVLGERGDEEALRRAVAAHENALREYTRERAPLVWAMTQTNLGNALQVQGERGDEQALHRAVAVYEAALSAFVSGRAARHAELCRANRERAIKLLQDRQEHREP